LDGVVKLRLATHKRRSTEPRSIRDVGLKVNVRHEDVASAGRAELRGWCLGCEEEEEEVGIEVGGSVGNDSGGLSCCALIDGVLVPKPLPKSGNIAIGNVDVVLGGRLLCDAVIAIVSFTAHSLFERG
jgi:hypothetical protein